MGIDGIGSSVIIALAAVLWFIYLVPTWLKRREYLSTERNAVRLQQTMRIMAESAELPDVVRVEANARAVAQQRARLAGQVRAAAAVRQAPQLGGAVRTRRLRRARGGTSLVLLASVIATGFGVSVLVTTGAWVLVAASATVGVGAFALLGQLSAVGRAHSELLRVQHAAPVAEPMQDYAPVERSDRPAGWTPVPVPKPLYLSHPVPATRIAPAVQSELIPRRDPAEVLRAAAAEAERALRSAQAEQEVARIRAAPVAPVAAPSRFASMGFVENADAVSTDLDDILRRRRQAS